MDPQAPVRPGDVLAGKYRVERVLGVGGMGVVVSALHLQLDERVALKFLLPEALANQEAVARFAREARAAVKIKSEHVARVVDVGNLENGAPYMVMEYLDGRDLSQVLEERGPLPVEEAVTYVLQACEAIAEAHALGIVHRDLKPSNLFLARRPDGRAIVKVLDFGISKVRAPGGMDDAAMTRTSSVMGSPLYMSPEQMAASRDVDPRSDIWAIGAVLYQLLTCSAPFVADTMPELCAKILTQPAASLRPSRPDIAPELEHVIFRCLEKNREHRFSTVAHLAAALAPFAPSAAESAARVARVLGVDPFMATAPPITAQPTTEPMPYPPPHAQPWAAPHGASRTGQAWGTTSSGTRGSSPWLVYALFGAMGVFAAMIFVVIVFVKLSSSSSEPKSAARTSEPMVPAATAIAPAATTDDLPAIHAPPPAVGKPIASANKPQASQQAINPPPPTINVVINPPPATTHAPPPPPPTPTKPDIF